MNSNRHHNKVASRAFTLIELLTVIAIIGILAAIIIPTVGKVRATAKTATSISNAKQVGMAMLLYAQENRSQILAHSYSPGYPTSEATYRQFANYLTRNPNGAGGATVVKERASEALAIVADVAIPESLRNGDPLTDKTYGQYRFTWTFNVIFNYNAGRQAEGVGPYSNLVGGAPRRINEFTDPSRTIYALSGRGYEISSTNIVDQALTNPNENALGAIAYYHRGGTGAAAIFLDGHTAVLSYPIDPKLTRISQFNN
jgi:prepilin-type N-terminal cleavage/methylation domain-containing protein